MLLREWWAAILTYPFLFAFEPWLVPNNPPVGLPHTGLPVVLVPGFFTNRGYLYAWRKYLLRNGYGKVYCVSPEPIFAGVEPNAEHLARFVDEVLAETGAPRVILIGHSMGGYVCLAFADLFPDNLKGFCLFHSTAYPDSEEKKTDRLRAINIVKANKNVYTKTTIRNLFAKKNLKWIYK